ncbi:MAG: ABC transporter permease [Chloroflexota bacterium]
MAKNSSLEPAVTLETTLRPRRGIAQRLGSFARKKPLGAIGAVLTTVMVIVAVFAPWLAPMDPYELNLDEALKPPGTEYVLGSDHLGRDILSRIIHGARVSLYVGLLAVALGQAGGGLLGLISGFFGGKVDLSIQRFMDILMAFPMLILALAIVAALGPSVNNVIVAISIVQTPRAARTMRSAAINVRETDYVSAARAIGGEEWYILFRHVAPNCVAPFIIIGTAALGQAIVTEATLSFLGVGSPPPTPSWGLMLSGEGRKYIEQAPWLAIFPGIAISLTVFGLNLLGDALRDVLDPRLRGT